MTNFLVKVFKAKPFKAPSKLAPFSKGKSKEPFKLLRNKSFSKAKSAFGRFLGQ